MVVLGPAARKLVLTSHVIASVGWLGSVAAFLALAIAGVASEDGQTVRAAYIAAEPMAWFVIIPLAVASLLTGVLQSLATTWGLFRHYWVLFKLAINVLATIILLLYTETLAELADRAAARPSAGLVEGLSNPSPVLHSSAALLLLIAATVLAIYKPRGLTRYGQRKQRQRLASPQAPS